MKIQDMFEDKYYHQTIIIIIHITSWFWLPLLILPLCLIHWWQWWPLIHWWLTLRSQMKMGVTGRYDSVRRYDMSWHQHSFWTKHQEVKKSLCNKLHTNNTKSSYCYGYCFCVYPLGNYDATSNQHYVSHEGHYWLVIHLFFTHRIVNHLIMKLWRSSHELLHMALWSHDVNTDWMDQLPFTSHQVTMPKRTPTQTIQPLAVTIQPVSEWVLANIGKGVRPSGLKTRWTNYEGSGQVSASWKMYLQFTIIKQQVKWSGNLKPLTSKWCMM